MRGRARTGRPGSRGLGTGPVAAAVAALGLAFLALPLVAMVGRTPWTAVSALAGDPDALAALRLSLVTSTAATVAAVAVGTPLAWVLARADFPGKALARGVVTLPMVLPPVVAGVALLAAFGRAGLLGGALAAVGVHLPFTPAGTALAQAFVGAPFYVIALEAGFATADRGLEEAAATLGAGRAQAWREVVLPAVWPAAVAGAALCWARALGEFGATITFAGSLQGRTQTLPLLVYQVLQTNPDGAIALALLLLVTSLGIVVGLRARLAVPR